MNFKLKHSEFVSECQAALISAVGRCFVPEALTSKAAEYTLMGASKRVRGVLTLAVCDMLCVGAPAQARLVNTLTARAFSAAIEMIHAFSLIHDDLPCMDDDDMRRGKPAAHIAYGEAAALLAGDLLAVEAFNALYSDDVPPVLAAKGMRVLASAAGARGMIFGQELDLKYEKIHADESDLNQIHRHKSGALICAATQLGVLAAGSEPNNEAEIAQYSDNIGLAFQIIDDVLDETSTDKQLGKPIGSDREKNKSTFVSVLGVDEARERVGILTGEAINILSGKYGASADFLCELAGVLARRVK